jgi:5-carboxymethyl-2-hydroxymuconate isomerase
MNHISIRNREAKIYPGKLLCIGRNYAAHAHELGNEVPAFPIVFMKSPSVMIPSGKDIVHPVYSNDMHHEIELVLLIGNNLKNASNEAAERGIFAYGVGLDMTLRDVQQKAKEKGHPWTLAKNFDGAAVLSEFLPAAEYQLNGDENIQLSVNGSIKQNSDLSKMIFSPITIVKYLSEKMTLEKGDLIFTGTPAGVGKVSRGDKIWGSIENIGEITTRII